MTAQIHTRACSQGTYHRFLASAGSGEISETRNSGFILNIPYRSGVLQINRYVVCSAHSLSFPVIIKHFFQQILDKSAACICREFLVGVILPFICKITYAFCNDNKRFWIGCMRCGISNKKIQHIYHSIYTSKNIALFDSAHHTQRSKTK